MAESSLGENAVVVGGSIAGIMAAAAVSPHFERVTVVDRDELDGGLAYRKGAPQARHLHGVLRRGLDGMAALFPGIEADLLALGSVPYKPARDVLVEDELGAWARFDVGPSILAQRRPVLEGVLRKRLAGVANVELRDRTSVRELRFRDGRVTGLLCERGTGSEWMDADLVIDAAGRSARSIDWLKQGGFALPPEKVVKVDVGYASAFFEPPADRPDWVGFANLGKAPEMGRIGLLLPQDDGRWLVSAGGRGSDQAPDDEAGYREFIRGLLAPTLFETLRGANMDGPIARFGYPASRWRRFEKLQAFPEGLLPVGDAICSFNPIYGQGMSVAACEVDTLRRVLAERAADGRGLDGVWSEYFAQAAGWVAHAWSMSATPDLAFPQSEGERPASFEQGRAFTRALNRLSQEDPEVRGTVTDVLHLMKPRSVLQEPALLERLMPLMAEA